MALASSPASRPTHTFPQQTDGELRREITVHEKLRRFLRALAGSERPAAFRAKPASLKDSRGTDSFQSHARHCPEGIVAMHVHSSPPHPSRPPPARHHLAAPKLQGHFSNFSERRWVSCEAVMSPAMGGVCPCLCLNGTAGVMALAEMSPCQPQRLF